MKFKYLFLIFISTVCYSNLLSAQNIVDTVRVKDSLKSVVAGDCSGIDSNFVKGRTLSTGIIRCSMPNSLNNGLFVTIPYQIQKKGKIKTIKVGELRTIYYHLLPGMGSVKNNSRSVVEGSKINFVCGVGDLIIYRGQPWSTAAMVYGTYDTSNGKYSINIREYVPLDE